MKIAYVDTEHIIKAEMPGCYVIWEHAEVTYLKGLNALRLALRWLREDPDCLAVQCNGILYLKGYNA